MTLIPAAAAERTATKLLELGSHKVEASALADSVGSWMKDQRWFQGKDLGGIAKVHIDDVFNIASPGTSGKDVAGFLLKTTVQHTTGDDVTYFLPLASGIAKDARFSLGKVQATDGVLHLQEGTEVPDVVRGLYELQFGTELTGQMGGRLVGNAAADAAPVGQLRVLPSGIDSSNTVKFLEPMGNADDRTRETGTVMSKLVRAHDPELRDGSTRFAGNAREMAMLQQNAGNPGAPNYLGALVYHGPEGAGSALQTVLLSTGYSPNKWSAFTEMTSSADRVAAQLRKGNVSEATRAANAYARKGAASMARAVADLHASNASGPAGSVWAGVTPTKERRLAEIAALRTQVEQLSSSPALAGRDVSALQQTLLKQIAGFERLAKTGEGPAYIQIHGDLHPGQALVNKYKTGVSRHTWTDFEGKPNQSAVENAIPQHVYDDIAQLAMSYDYAGEAAVTKALQGVTNPATIARVKAGVQQWVDTAKQAVWREYHAAASGATFEPAGTDAQAAARAEKELKIALHNLRYESGAGRGLEHVPINQLDAIAARNGRTV